LNDRHEAALASIRRRHKQGEPWYVSHMRGAVRLFLGLLVVLGVLWPRPALANGRFPASNAVIFDPHDEKTIYVRVTFGLLATHDGGQTWRWICERAIGFSGVEDPTYVVTPKGTLVGGTFSGIAVSRDGGCAWSFAGGAGSELVSDLAMRTDGTIVGIKSVYKKPGEYDNKLLISKDDAQSFTAMGATIDPTMILESVEIADSDPVRLYISSVRGEGADRTAAFLVSYNDGMSWTERKLELVAGETAAFIALVDPKKADRVYVRTAGAPESKSRLLVTDDAGKTWRKVFDSPSPLLGFSLSPDGSKVIVGAKEGVQYAKTDDFVFTKGSSAEVQCLGMKGETLWSCSTERSGFFVGQSKTNGRSFNAMVHLEEIKGPLECPGESSVGKQCDADWVKQRRDLGLPDPSEKGKSANPGGPALHGTGTQTKRRGPSPLAAAFGIAAVGLIGYEILKRLKRGRK
jgi:photosystem II stability/assembly factor-like uncharacterized protein